jgi:hypothetical protein
VTKYGIVEVIHDNRETPTAILPPDFTIQLKAWHNWKMKRDRVVSNKKICFTVLSLTRRTLLQKYYVNHNVNQRTVFHSLYGGDPRTMDPRDHSKAITTTADPKYIKQNPYELDGSYPDR